MTIDLTAIETQLMLLLGSITLSILIAAGRLVLKRLTVSLSVAQKTEWEADAAKALAFGFAGAKDLIAEKGWDHPEVQNAVIFRALGYASDKFPAALARIGIDVRQPGSRMQMIGTMQRKFPEAAAIAAASPAMPPAPPTAGAVAAIVPTGVAP